MGKFSIKSTFAATVAIGVAAVLALSAGIASGPGAAAASHKPGGKHGAKNLYAPNKHGELDCNHYSPIQKSIKRTLACTDVHGLANRAKYHKKSGRFYDNGHYIGHDEPDLRFLSNQPGSGNDVKWNYKLGTDPSAAPTATNPGHDVTKWFELTPAPWLSMALCDPGSYPELSCTPNSDSNAPVGICTTGFPCPSGVYPGAGSAFMEMQFYAPGFAPFSDALSCDNTHWCAALTIDSLEGTSNFATINPNCEEPQNFAFIQRDGVPTGPPSPQLSSQDTYTPNSQTLLMNPGDNVSVHMFDSAVPGTDGEHAVKIVINDATTGQSGTMQASAANGFASTDLTTCDGTPFDFEPEYSTAAANNIVPWAALQTDISTEFETGHWEACSSISGEVPGQDPYWSNCEGPYEATAPADGGDNPEISDAPCYQKGDTHAGLGTPSAPDTITGCALFYTQNGDLDFDGQPYWPDWPTGVKPTSTFPGSFVESAPTFKGRQYGRFQLQTNVALSEETTCAPGTPDGCTAPPPNAPGHFYPYWTQKKSGCAWNFGNVSKGTTFGGVAQYGKVQWKQLGYPLLEGPVRKNPCASG